MPDTYPHLHIAIICDNSYHDLWPFARQQSPRDLITVTGDETSLLRRMVATCLPLSEHPVHVVCDPDATDVYRNHLIAPHDAVTGAESDLPAEAGDASSTEGPTPAVCGFAESQIDLLPVPMRRNNAFPIALVAAHLRLADPDAMLLVLRSGIRFEPGEVWEAAVSRSYKTAQQGYLTVVGIHPTTATTVSNHGFMKRGVQLPDIPGVFRVNEFIDRARGSLAARLNDPRAFWYTGIAMMSASVLLGELHRPHDDAPAFISRDPGGIRIAEVAGFLASLGREYWNQPDAHEVISTLPDASIGACVFELSDRMAVVESSLEWQDISSLAALDELEKADADHNRITGNASVALTEDTTVYAGRRLIATLGIKGLLVVDTPDTTLIARKDRLDELEVLLEELRQEEAPELARGAVSWRPWGRIEKLRHEDTFSIERIEVTAGNRTPLQSHNDRGEQLTVTSGTGALHVGNRTHHLGPRASYAIEPGSFYSLEADDDMPLTVISIRTNVG